MKLRQAVERHAGEGVMCGMILHIPAQPAHRPPGPRAAGVAQHVADMRHAQMLDRVLQLMRRLGQQHRREPVEQRRLAARRDRDGGDQRVSRHVPARLADHQGVARRRDIALVHLAARRNGGCAPPGWSSRSRRAARAGSSRGHRAGARARRRAPSPGCGDGGRSAGSGRSRAGRAGKSRSSGPPPRSATGCGTRCNGWSRAARRRGS